MVAGGFQGEVMCKVHLLLPSPINVGPRVTQAHFLLTCMINVDAVSKPTWGCLLH